MGLYLDLKTSAYCAVQQEGDRFDCLEDDQIRTQQDSRKSVWDDARARTRQIVFDAMTVIRRNEPHFVAAETVELADWFDRLLHPTKWNRLLELRLVGACQGMVQVARGVQWVELSAPELIESVTGDRAASRAAMGRRVRNLLRRADLTPQTTEAAALAVAALIRGANQPDELDA